MGRDSVLPHRLFGGLHKRFRTPVFNIVLTGVIGVIALFLDVLSAASFINFGAFVAFTMVNLSVIFSYFRDEQTKARYGVLKAVVIPLLGAIVNVWLLTKLDRNAVILGSIWLFLGFLQLNYLTNFFTKEPPEVDFDEESAISENQAELSVMKG